MVESFGAPHTQRLLSALVQERALKLTNPVSKNTENGVKINKMKGNESVRYFSIIFKWNIICSIRTNKNEA